MPRKKKRIGLVLSQIFSALSQNVWGSFVRTAKDKGASLFIIPGGRLNSFHEYENLRNQIYSLVNAENLDGCVTWSSTIHNKQLKEEFEHFHGGFDPLPFVTIGFKVPGHPYVDYDAYNGMKTLVNHCIQVHGAKKIAFLRGPDGHQSAQDRLNGYYDAIKEAGPAEKNEEKDSGFQSALITDPFNWDAGDTAAAQLFKGRLLVPGRDFDTLAGSSDLMVLKAIDYFSAQGYHVPLDYHAVGFNNSVESKVVESTLSTVQLPYEDLARESFGILLDMMDAKKPKSDKNPADTDVFLKTEVVIRKSCGCNFLSGMEENSFINHDAVILPAIHALRNGDKERFLVLFEKAVISYFDSGKEPENLFPLIKDLNAVNLNLDDKIRDFELTLYSIIFSVKEQLVVRERYKKEWFNKVLNSLKCDLLGTRNRFSLIQNLARHLPIIGINIAAIILYSDEKHSVFVGGFSRNGICSVREQRFPARLLVPANLRQQFDDDIFLVQPLFIENQSLGYFIHNISIIDGVIFEDLRSSLSYALKGIFLQEETVRAKKIAEQVEYAKTEFYHTLENSIHEPFQDVAKRLESIEQSNSIDDIKSNIQELKSFIVSKKDEAGSLMDIALAGLNELALNKIVFDPEELLPKIGVFPLLVGDTVRLAQCFSMIREQYSAGYSAKLCYEGFLVTFRSVSKKTNKIDKALRFNMLLAEKVILLHGGSLTMNRDNCAITLPWPTLTGQELSRQTIGSHNNILVISDSSLLPANFLELPQINNPEEAKHGKTAFITWNAAGARLEELVIISGLRHRSELAGLPFLCYGMPSGVRGSIESAATLIETIEYALKSPRKGTVIFIGSKKYWQNNMKYILPDKENRLDTIRIDSMSDFYQTVNEINNPVLIVFAFLDMEGVSTIRQHPLTVMIPVVMIFDRINNPADIRALSCYSRLLIYHQAVINSEKFQRHIKAIIGGEETLPPYVSVLVKNAVLYLDQHIESHISRLKLADSVNVNEDYLTRIFHKETGFSIWDYLVRLRIYKAAELLRKTDDTIQNIAFKTGFNDHTYFYRAFKKIYGLPPGQIRKQ